MTDPWEQVGAAKIKMASGKHTPRSEEEEAEEDEDEEESRNV